MSELDKQLAPLARELQETEEELTRRNEEVRDLQRRKKELRKTIYHALEAAELEGIHAGDIVVSRYELAFAQVEDAEAFEEWASVEDENYFEERPRPRKELLNQLVRQRLDDGEPLPPGLGVWIDERISRNKA